MPKKGQHRDEEILFEADSADAEYGEEDLTDLSEAATKKVKDLKEQLARCRKERQEYLDGWQRQKADFLNARRRMEEERAGDATRNTAGFVEKLIPLADSFDVALREGSGGQSSQWRDGVEHMRTQLLSILASFGVSVLDPVGEPFDPAFHEAVSEQPVEQEEEHQRVCEVLQKGYALNGRVIRPAKVVVGRYDG